MNLDVSIEKLCFASSDEELLAKVSRPNAHTVSVPSGGGGMDFPELKGKFEIYLKRISDE
jgi:hypothetical protein